MYAAHLWDSLNEENRISLYVKQIEPLTNEVKTIIINKHQ